MFYISLFFILPWVWWFRFPPWLAFHADSLAVFAALLYLFFLLNLNISRGGRGCLNVNFCALGSTLFMLIAVLYGWAPVFVLYVGLFIFLVFTVQEVLKDIEIPLIVILSVFLLGGLINSIIVWAQQFDTAYRWGGWMAFLPPGSDRAAGNLGQPNQAATLLLMAWAALTVLFEQGRLKAWAWYSGCCVLWASIVFTQSRTGLLSLLLMTAFGLFASVKLAGVRPVQVMTAGKWWLSLGTFAGIMWVTYASGPSLASRLDDDQLTSSNGRWAIWQQVWKGIEASPWWGYGPMQSAAAQRVGAEVIEAGAPIQYAHNLILDLMVWFGIPMALLLLGGALWWLWRTWKANPTYAASRPLLVLVPFAVHSTLEMPFSYAYFLFPAAILMGIYGGMAGQAQARAGIEVCAPAEPGSDLWFRMEVQKATMWLILAVYTALGCAIVRDYVLVEEDFRVVRFEILRVGRTPPEYQQPKMWVLTQFDDVLSGARVKPRPGQPPEDIAKLQRAVRHFPWAPLDSRLVASLALNGRETEALAHLRMLKNYYAPSIYNSIISYLKLQAQSHKPLGELLQKAGQ